MFRNKSNFPIFNPAPLFNIICRYVALNQITHPLALYLNLPQKVGLDGAGLSFGILMV